MKIRSPLWRGFFIVVDQNKLGFYDAAKFFQGFINMCKDGLKDDALDLKESTVHWLRHTGISKDVRSRPREHVRDEAGHAAMATTDRYIESDQREHHHSGKKKPVQACL